MSPKQRTSSQNILTYLSGVSLAFYNDENTRYCTMLSYTTRRMIDETQVLCYTILDCTETAASFEDHFF